MHFETMSELGSWNTFCMFPLPNYSLRLYMEHIFVGHSISELVLDKFTLEELLSISLVYITIGPKY